MFLFKFIGDILLSLKLMLNIKKYIKYTKNKFKYILCFSNLL